MSSKPSGVRSCGECGGGGGGDEGGDGGDYALDDDMLLHICLK